MEDGNNFFLIAGRFVGQQDTESTWFFSKLMFLLVKFKYCGTSAKVILEILMW